MRLTAVFGRRRSGGGGAVPRVRRRPLVIAAPLGTRPLNRRSLASLSILLIVAGTAHSLHRTNLPPSQPLCTQQQKRNPGPASPPPPRPHRHPPPLPAPGPGSPPLPPRPPPSTPSPPTPTVASPRASQRLSSDSSPLPAKTAIRRRPTRPFTCSTPRTLAPTRTPLHTGAAPTPSQDRTAANKPAPKAKASPALPARR